MGSAFVFSASRRAVLFLISAGVVLIGSAADASVITTFGTPVPENFDTLVNSGTSSTLPTGWFLSETGSNSNTTYAAGTGSDNAGNTYSFGASGSNERAFGTLLSGSLTSTIGASFTNDTGGTITSVEISYIGEQWRLGTADRADRIDFQYSLDASGLTSGTWMDLNSLDFSSPSVTTTGLKDGNLAANRTALSDTILGLSILDGATFWIRWTDFNASGADDGLAVDDFSLTANGTLPPTGVIPEASTFLVWSLLCGSVLVGLKRSRG